MERLSRYPPRSELETSSRESKLSLERDPHYLPGGLDGFLDLSLDHRDDVELPRIAGPFQQSIPDETRLVCEQVNGRFTGTDVESWLRDWV